MMLHIPWPGPERVWNEIAKQVLTDHQYSTSLACGRKKIEKSQPSTIHFFTIVLNGQPIHSPSHRNLVKKLPFDWHWHIIEGVADLKHDTSWCSQNGGRVGHSLHQCGLSNDGISEYLDRLAIEHSDQITLYRKSEGAFWDGKLEMVNAPLVVLMSHAFCGKSIPMNFGQRNKLSTLNGCSKTLLRRQLLISIVISLSDPTWSL